MCLQNCHVFLLILLVFGKFSQMFWLLGKVVSNYLSLLQLFKAQFVSSLLSCTPCSKQAFEGWVWWCWGEWCEGGTSMCVERDNPCRNRGACLPSAGILLNVVNQGPCHRLRLRSISLFAGGWGGAVPQSVQPWSQTSLASALDGPKWFQIPMLMLSSSLNLYFFRKDPSFKLQF